MTNPSERSMERALSVVEMTPGSDEWRIDAFNAACREVAAAIDEAREEGRREGLEEAARLCGSDQLRSAAMRGEKWDAARYACRDAIRARSNPSECPSCGSRNPKMHPAVQAGGEAHLCEDHWHSPTADEIRRTESEPAEGGS